MRILIVGAGRVGESVAEALVSEENDITIVDTDATRLADLQARMDLRGVAGSGSYPSVLRDAGAADAELLIACAASDEVNLVVSRLARDMFNIPTRIVRLRAPEFQEQPEATQSAFAADVMICPEQSVTNTILKLVEFPEALQVLEFANGALSLIAVRAVEGGLLVRQSIKELKTHLPKDVQTRIVAIYRRDGVITPDGDTRIEPGDEVFFLAASEDIRTVMRELRKMDRPVKRVMIAGGGNIGLRLARELDGQVNLRIIEPRKSRAEYLASETSSKTLVLNGDATDEDLLTDEAVADMDLFIAVTNDDENNIMAALLAKRLGARRVIALINRKAYADMMQGSRIDIAIAPSQATISDMLTHVRRGDVVRVHSLRRGAAEAIEAVARGDVKSSKVVGRRAEEIDLPKGATIGAIVRGLEAPEGAARGKPEVIIVHHDTLIEANDHVIVFVANRRQISKVERLFQVGIGFF
jgi:trk system potassium uptake protein